MTRVDHIGSVALRKVGNPESFSVCGWEALDDGSCLVRMKRELPRIDGERRKWTGPEKTACVTDAEIIAEEARYEADTGKCSKCDGTGQQWDGWNCETGNRFKPCTKCGATGRPANADLSRGGSAAGPT